jgi:hypothetical protein
VSKARAVPKEDVDWVRLKLLADWLLHEPRLRNVGSSEELRSFVRLDSDKSLQGGNQATTPWPNADAYFSASVVQAPALSVNFAFSSVAATRSPGPTAPKR